MDPDLLTLADVAKLTGLSLGSVRAYHSAANRARRTHQVVDTDMPAPDRIVVRTPTWRRRTIDQWMRARETRRREAELAGERWASRPTQRKAEHDHD
jgi:predicted DNA-binding transcriptional regulator AlpA